MRLLFTILMVYLAIGEPLIESLVFAQFKGNRQDKSSRITMYKHAFIRSWILAIFFFGTVFYFQIPLGQFGFQDLNNQYFINLPLAIKIILTAIFITYFIYFYYFSVIIYRFNVSIKEKVVAKLLPFKDVLPENKNERLWWMANAFTSFIEEVLYRGFVIYYVTTIFPVTNIWIAAVISVLLDSLRYITRPAAVFYIIYSSSVFVIAYIIFHSIYIAILLHIIHDMRVLWMPIDEVIIFAKNILQPARYKEC